MDIEDFEHKFAYSGGLKLHIAEIGHGPNVVVFLHGFPEIWYTWRHQMVDLASCGFRAIAPDFRGFGHSEPPRLPRTTTLSDFLSDLLVILDAFDLIKVFLVGKGFGARTAYLFSILHPERVLGVVTLGVPYVPPRPFLYHEFLPEGFYMLRWRESGRAEADFGRLDAKTVVRNIYILFSGSRILIAQENQEIMDMVEPSAPLPPWITEEEIEIYGSLYEKSGFQTALQVPYRSFGEELIEELAGAVVKVPALLIMGEKDYVLKFPGIEELVNSEKAKELVPNLEITLIPEGTHFIHEQFPEQEVKMLHL